MIKLTPFNHTNRKEVPVTWLMEQSRELDITVGEIAQLLDITEFSLRSWVSCYESFCNGELYDNAIYLARLYNGLMQQFGCNTKAIVHWLNTPSIANNQYSPKTFMLDGGNCAVKLFVWKIEDGQCITD